MKKSLAFTLSEVLIALGVIGVVASLTLPQMIEGKQASDMSARFNTAYNMLSKTFDDMESSGVSVLPANYSATQSLRPRLLEFFKVSVDCGDWNSKIKNEKLCINRRAEDNSGNDDNYRTIDGSQKMDLTLLDDGAFVINNGMLIAMENEGGLKKDGKTLMPVLVSIDINGKDKKPNKWGWDLFTFELTNSGLLPYGAPGTSESLYKDGSKTRNKYSGTSDDAYCNPKSNAKKNLNGVTCAYKAIVDSDYFNKLYKNH